MKLENQAMKLEIKAKESDINANKLRSRQEKLNQDMMKTILTNNELVTALLHRVNALEKKVVELSENNAGD